MPSPRFLLHLNLLVHLHCHYCQVWTVHPSRHSSLKHLADSGNSNIPLELGDAADGGFSHVNDTRCCCKAVALNTGFETVYLAFGNNACAEDSLIVPAEDRGRVVSPLVESPDGFGNQLVKKSPVFKCLGKTRLTNECLYFRHLCLSLINFLLTLIDFKRQFLNFTLSIVSPCSFHGQLPCRQALRCVASVPCSLSRSLMP